MSESNFRSHLDPLDLKLIKNTLLDESSAPDDAQKVVEQSQPDFGQAALDWYQFGLQVIPLLPQSKFPALPWDGWLADLSPEAIAVHWKRHPDHEIGFIVGPDHIVLDADSPEALANLVRIEEERGVSPRLIVGTHKGVHHHFRLAPGTYARSAAFSTEKFPAGIDVKTGRAIAALPPSTGKEILSREVDHASQLSEVGQDFIDAVFLHNGKQPPRPRPVQPDPAPSSPGNAGSDDESPLTGHHDLEVLIEPLDPDEGYEPWVDVGMILYHETGGSDEGLKIFDSWSARGAKYPGFRDIQYKWQSFGGYAGNPKTMGTLKWMLKERGLDWRELLEAAEPGFTPIEISEESGLSPETGAAVIANNSPATGESAPVEPILNPLLAYSLSGMLPELQRDVREQQPILGEMALRGQYTLFFAAPNTGKTLLGIWMLLETIKARGVNPQHVFYLNADDHHQGLIQKLELAEEHDFHMIAPGYKGFSVKQLPEILRALIANGLAASSVIILDTVKKFSSPMDKVKMAAFNDEIRPFIALGGTVIGFAHVNKNRDLEGRRVYGGTSDVVDDVDCAYLLDVVDTNEETQMRTIEFECIKSRGGVVKKAAYCYSIADGLSYNDLLASVKEVDPDTLEVVRQAGQVKAQEPIIDGIKTCIRGGTTLKMSLIRSVANQLGVSQRQVKQILEDHTGTDPMHQHWNFTKGDRGAMNYSLL